MRNTILCFAAASLFAAASAQAADTVTLKVADSFPVTHILSKEGAKYWMDRTTELSKGAVTFNYFPGQQLGKAGDMLRLAQSGVTDIAYIAPSYVSERMPLSEAIALPGMVSDSCSATAAYWKLTQSGLIKSMDFDGNDMLPLFAVVLPPYQFFGPTAPITSLNDIKGMKIRSGGGQADLLISELGGVPIKLTAPETREALERGTIDLHLGNNSSQEPYGHLPFIKTGTTGAPLTSFVVTYSISKSKWASLTEAQQKVLLEAGQDTNQHLCARLDEEDKIASKRMEEAGAKFYRLTDADRANFATIAEAVAKRWAEAEDKRGKPGIEVLDEIRSALAVK